MDADEDTPAGRGRGRGRPEGDTIFIASASVRVISRSPPNQDVLDDVLDVMEHIKPHPRGQGYLLDAGLGEVVAAILTARPAPFARVLAILAEFPISGKKKKNFGPAIAFIEEVARQKDLENVRPDREDAEAGFDAAVRWKDPKLAEALAVAFEMRDHGRALLPRLRAIVAEGDHRTAHRFATILDLRDSLAVRELLLPLALANEAALVDEQLSQHPDRAAALVLALDEVAPDKRDRKRIGRIIDRLCERHGLDEDVAQNHRARRRSAFLRYVVPKKFIDADMSDEAFREVVREAVGDSPELRALCVSLVSEHSEEDALSFAREFGVDESAVRSRRPRPRSGAPAPAPYGLRLPPSRVFVVDAPDAFSFALRALVGEKIVGLDCEWKPQYASKRSRVSLLQVATPSAVYLFDVLRMDGPRAAPLWAELAEVALENPDVLKIGFGVKNDLRELRTTIPGYDALRSSDAGYLDLAVLWKRFLHSGARVPYRDGRLDGKLASVVRQCFGRTLDKGEQCSNWENRPLRMSQIRYAALDALVLLDVFSFIREGYLECGVDFDAVVSDVIAADSRPSDETRNRRRAAGKPTGKTDGNGEKEGFLLDDRLKSMLKYLRYCGVDAFLWSNDFSTLEELVQFSKRTSRRLIVSSEGFDGADLRSEAPKSAICFLPSRSIEDGLIEVLKFFEINLDAEDFYKRCVMCNYDVIVRLSRGVLRRLLEKRPEESRPTFDRKIDAATRLIESGKTSFGNPVQVSNVTDDVLNSNEFFFICEKCGYLFWNVSVESEYLFIHNIIHKRNNNDPLTT